MWAVSVADVASGASKVIEWIACVVSDHWSVPQRLLAENSLSNKYSVHCILYSVHVIYVWHTHSLMHRESMLWPLLSLVRILPSHWPLSQLWISAALSTQRIISQKCLSYKNVWGQKGGMLLLLFQFCCKCVYFYLSLLLFFFSSECYFICGYFSLVAWEQNLGKSAMLGRCDGVLDGVLDGVMVL